jgi:RHS repeat-associated protein
LCGVILLTAAPVITVSKISDFTANHLGSPRILTDENGATISRRDFHPFGEEIVTTERIAPFGYQVDDVRQKFTTYLRDAETTLDYAGARYHASSLGRFQSADNFLNDTITSDTQSWNLYVYARNNPLYYVDPFGEKIYVGYITDDKERAEFLRRVNFTYGCETCVSVDADGYLTVDTSGLDEAIINATQFLTDAINSDDPSKLFTVEITNNNNAVAFGDSGTRRGVAVRQADGTTVTVSAINIRLDFGDDAHVRGDDDVRASFLNLVFAHEVSHFYPTYKTDPTVPGERGPVDNPINEIRLALGLPLRGEYQARRLHVGSTVYLRFGNPIRPPFGGPIRGSDGLEVEMNRMILWVQDNVKR